MITGIPYFGIKHNEIVNNILGKEAVNDNRSLTLKELADLACGSSFIVVIDNKWLTWLHDIKFDYKNKKCYIPYYTYKLHNTKKSNYRSDDKGHLILNNGVISIRHDYKLNNLDITVDNFRIIIYNLTTNKKEEIVINGWCNETCFNINALYNLYIDSCYYDDDFVYLKHLEGYHKIDIDISKVNNRERKLRTLYGLKSWDESANFEEYKDYRDVRQYSYNEVIVKVGMRETLENYKIRRLRFESSLYCILRAHIKPYNKSFYKEWDRLGITKDYIKYGRNIKLIFKSYWLDSYRPLTKKSWYRI